ncbi:MAG TPA: energy transducer TonB [Pyrinomonadaceae bacterium]
MKRVLILILISTVSGHLVPRMAQDPNDADDKVYDGKQVDTTVKIISKPEPKYTFEALKQHVVGGVRLTAVFTAKGEVRNVEVVNGLPAGLTDSAIAVAREIKFTPAMKDGRPVSLRMQLEYRFELFDVIIHGQRFPKLFYDERCRDYTNIAPENMVFFTSEKEAKKAGYKKSKTCP